MAVRYRALPIYFTGQESDIIVIGQSIHSIDKVPAFLYCRLETQIADGGIGNDVEESCQMMGVKSITDELKLRTYSFVFSGYKNTNIIASIRYDISN